MFPKKVVIPAEAGIQSFQRSLDAPVSSTGQAPQVRHDGKDINGLTLIIIDLASIFSIYYLNFASK
jgi:hypothetical protein